METELLMGNHSGSTNDDPVDARIGYPALYRIPIKDHQRRK